MNNKTALTIRLVTLIISLIFVIVLCGGIIMAIRGYDFGLYTGGENALPVLNREFNQSEITKLDLHTVSADILVCKGDTDVVKVEYQSDRDSDRASVSLENGVLSVQQQRTFSFFQWITGRTRLVVTVPEKATYVLNVNSTSGDIACDTAAPEAMLRSTSGEIQYSGDCQAALTVETVSGDVRLQGKAGQINVKTTSGDIDCPTPAETVTANSTSGEVWVKADNTTKSISTNTVSGEVTVGCAQTDGYTVTMSSVSGDCIDSQNHGKMEHGGSYRYGTGALKVDVHTVSGDLSIE